MSFIVNISQIKVNSVANNASIDVGPCIHNSHASNTKIWGSNMSSGDHTPTTSTSMNHVFDADVNDQSEWFGADTVQTNQD